MDLRRSMLETDGPRHRALRKLLQRDFSAGNRCATTKTSCAA